MSELKAFTFGLGRYTENGSPCVVAFDEESNPRLASDEKFYLKSEADKVIAEKDAEIESLKASHYAESVDAGMRERRLRRALYKACANWALSTLAWLDCIDQGEPRKWSEMVQKCRAKAEEYK